MTMFTLNFKRPLDEAKGLLSNNLHHIITILSVVNYTPITYITLNAKTALKAALYQLVVMTTECQLLVAMQQMF